VVLLGFGYKENLGYNWKTVNNLPMNRKKIQSKKSQLKKKNLKRFYTEKMPYKRINTH
jgi:hypothetical protein